jgi:catechol 2,3-dioxygenase-like lactoylglutathione lyase family enzyme
MRDTMRGSLENIRLLVDDFDGCFRFYRDVLELKIVWGKEGSNYASFAAGQVTLSIFMRRLMSRDMGTQDLPYCAEAQDKAVLAFRVDDLEAEVVRILEKGWQLSMCVTPRPNYGMRTAHLRDPDGNLIELFSPLPKEQWSKDLLEEAEEFLD